MVKEATVVKRIKDTFKKLFNNPSITKIHVSPLHNRGFPDLVIVTEYGTFFLEAKRPGNKPTKLQRAKLMELKRSGGNRAFSYWVTCCKENSKKLLFFDPETDVVEVSVECSKLK